MTRCSMLGDVVHRRNIAILSLWILAVIWLRPWTGDLRGDQLVYGCVAKDMAENGHWFSPMLDGKPYLNKPPLYFWIVALFFKVFGPSYYVARLPSLLFATIDVLFLYWIVYRNFRDYDIALFSAFAFTTTRWIVKEFASNRPESLLAFSVLLGFYAYLLMRDKDWRGPYILGVAFAIGFMTKLFFALFLPAAVFLTAVVTRRLGGWLRWAHTYAGGIFGLLLILPWFIYYASRHPDYMGYLVGTQTIERITTGLDVNLDPFMYLKEIVMFYHPWLVFFLLGVAIFVRRLRDEPYLFVIVALLVMFVPLQVATGKASRYLTTVTPFMSILVGAGVATYARPRKVVRGLAAYGIIPLLVAFWVLPLRVNPERFHVVHLAERLSGGARVKYTDFFASIRSGRPSRTGNNEIVFASWAPPETDREYRFVHYFYLSDSFEYWDDARLDSWARAGDPPLVLFTVPGTVSRLPRNGITWVKLASDEKHALLVGIHGNHDGAFPGPS